VKIREKKQPAKIFGKNNQRKSAVKAFCENLRENNQRKSAGKTLCENQRERIVKRVLATSQAQRSYFLVKTERSKRDFLEYLT